MRIFSTCHAERDIELYKNEEILNCIKMLVNISRYWCFYCSFKLAYKILQTFHLLFLSSWYLCEAYKSLRHIMKKKGLNTFDAVICENTRSSLDVPFNQNRRQAKYFCVPILFFFMPFKNSQICLISLCLGFQLWS